MTDTERYRAELQAHCYRMLGSFHEAQDAVQETMLRAWRGRDRLEDGAALRHWLYRIATNVCLSAIARRASLRRLVPQLAGPSSARLPEGKPVTENRWLEPYPDAVFESIPDPAPSPQARYEMREATQLAFVAAIQYLPPRQRATLLLRDVLGWSAVETAQTLDSTVTSINSALQRARDTLRKKVSPDEWAVCRSLPDDRQSRLLDRYVHTWESADLDGFVALLKEDAIFSMPPYSEWYQGRDAIRPLLSWAWPETGFTAFRLVPIQANGQSSFALYGRSEKSKDWQAHALQVLSHDEQGIAVITQFMDLALFSAFGLPEGIGS